MTLPHLNNAYSTEASAADVNEERSIIVGSENTFGKSTALLWSHRQVFFIQKLLESEGVNLGGHNLNRASAISAKGLHVTGSTSCSKG